MPLRGKARRCLPIKTLEPFGARLKGREMRGKLVPAIPKRPITELARAIRMHLKAGKSRRDILEAESITEKQFRYAMKQLGRFPMKNIEAFSHFLVGAELRLEELGEDMSLVRQAGDHKSLAAFHRVRNEIVLSISDLAMKLGLLQKAAEKLEVAAVREFTVGFGDESIRPNWPTLDVPAEPKVLGAEIK
jgi:hypothetical protein